MPLGALYATGVRLRRCAYRAGWAKARRLPCLVVSVGNLTVGGSGKTPLVRSIAEFYRDRGRKVAVLSRGYGRGSTDVRVVHDGTRLRASPTEAGDEPYLLATWLERVPVVVGASRYDAGRIAYREFRPEVIVLDDGFQHMRLHRDLNLILLDATLSPAALRPLPAGLLREPLSSLLDADQVIITKSREASLPPSLARFLPPHAIPLFCQYTAESLWSFPGKEPVSWDEIAGRRVLAFCGIASPDSFVQTLHEVNAEVVRFVPFADHHSYSKEDVAHIFSTAGEAGAEVVVTTEKDAIKIETFVDSDRKLLVVGIRHRILREEDRARWEELLGGMLGCGL